MLVQYDLKGRKIPLNLVRNLDWCHPIKTMKGEFQCIVASECHDGISEYDKLVIVVIEYMH